MTTTETRRPSFIKPLNTISVRDALVEFRAPKRFNGRIQILIPFAVSAPNTYSAHAGAPLGPAYLAATLEAAGYDVDVIDAQGEGIDQFRKTECGRYLLHGLSDDAIMNR